MLEDDSLESDDMTVEDQNRSNSESDDIQNVLATFMGCREETLEELVGEMMILTMDDLKMSWNHLEASALNVNSHYHQDNTIKATSITGEAGESTSQTRSVGEHNSTVAELPATKMAKPLPDESTFSTADNIEEVLSEKLFTEDSLDTVLRQRPSLTKFDNFISSVEEDVDNCGEVTTADQEDDDWLLSAGYCCSFAHVDGLSAVHPRDGDLTEEHSTPQALRKVALQTSENEEKAMQCLPLHPQYAIQSLAKASHSGIILSKHEPVVTKICDKDASVLLLGQDNSADTDTEDNESHQVESSSASLHQSSGTQKESQSDVISSEKRDETLASQDPQGQRWTLNPGEVEDGVEEGREVTRSIRVMDFAMKIVGPDVDQEKGLALSADSVEACSDEVVPFSLDEDFDYENVVYTPKFTAEEIRYLASFIPNRSGQ